MRNVIFLILVILFSGCTTHPGGSPFRVPKYSTERLWSIGDTTWQLVNLTYSADGGVAASYRLPGEVSQEQFTEIIGFRIFKTGARLEDFVQGIESGREFDKQLTVSSSKIDNTAWLVAHSSPLWGEHGVALFVAGPQDGFLFYYTTRRVENFKEPLDRWTRLLLGTRA